MVCLPAECVACLFFPARAAHDLALTLRAVGEELGRDAATHQPVMFDIAIEGESRNLDPLVREEIYKIGCEALRNAFRHAHARRVCVEICYDAQQLRLRARHDGKRIDQALAADRDVHTIDVRDEVHQAQDEQDEVPDLDGRSTRMRGHVTAAAMMSELWIVPPIRPHRHLYSHDRARWAFLLRGTIARRHLPAFFVVGDATRTSTFKTLNRYRDVTPAPHALTLFIPIDVGGNTQDQSGRPRASRTRRDSEVSVHRSITMMVRTIEGVRT
jgi:hypothetical protein